MQVEIWSDVVCPWCAVGKARFEAAVGGLWWADEVEVRWRSFELDPTRPRADGRDYVQRLADKYRTSREQARVMVDRMTATGAAAGLDFRFDRAQVGNTFDAHRLLHLAADRGRQHEVKARFLAGYHTEGAAIGDHGTLVRLASEAGLDAGEVERVLGSDDYAEAVRADEALARAIGIRGVPFFLLNRSVGLSGAQPVEVLRQELEEVRCAAPTRVHDHADGDACTDRACAV